MEHGWESAEVPGGGPGGNCSTVSRDEEKMNLCRRKPREKFVHKALRALSELENEAKVEIYKSKNIRVKLINTKF